MPKRGRLKSESETELEGLKNLADLPKPSKLPKSPSISNKIKLETDSSVDTEDTLKIAKNNSKSTTSTPKSTSLRKTLFSPFPKKDARNFTENTVIAEDPIDRQEYDSFEISKGLRLIL